MNIVYTGENDSRAFKNVIGETVEALMKEDDKVVWLDADLMSCSGTNKGTGDRYINCGIAEANMIGVAAGLSASGFKPYAHSFGCFASRRVFDQAFLAGGYAGNSITVVGTDPGITAAFNGGTHMPFEDMALYRAIPGSYVFDITDVPMLVDVLRQCKDIQGIKYIRVPRKTSYQIYADGSSFEIGKGQVVRDGKDGVIVACGIMVHEALQAAKALEAEGMDIAVIDPITVKPLDAELIRSYAEKTGLVIVAENHNRVGGLTSAVEDVIIGLPLKFGAVAVEESFGEVGPQDYLRTRFDLTSDHIVRLIHGLK